MTRTAKYSGYLSAYLLVFLAILAAGNYLANRYNKTYDATRQKVHTLADQTVKIAKNLSSDVKLYYFDRPDSYTRSSAGPSPKDLLTRYENLSPKIRVEYINPEKNPKRARDMGVTDLGQLFVETGGRREEAKGLGEEQVTNAIIRALKPGKPAVCFLTGHSELSLEVARGDGLSAFKELLEGNNYKTEAISLQEAKDAAVPPACIVLVVAGPKIDFVAAELDMIRKFLHGGGRALFLMNPQLKGTTTKALEAFLAEFSVNLDDNLVIDVSGVGQLFGIDETVPLVSRYESHAIVKEMTNVATVFPITRSMQTGTGKDKVAVEKLFSSGRGSLGVPGFRDGAISVKDPKNVKGPLPLAVAGTYGAGRESGVPNGGGRFVVVGTALFVSNSGLGLPVGNKDLALNMLNWLTGDEDLISIRPKEAEDNRLTITAAQMNRLLYTNVLGLPLLIIAAGTWMWWKRR